jgi:NADH-quinone oxidoreductase subunit L
VHLEPWVILTILFSPLAAFVVQILFGKALFMREGQPNTRMGAIVPILGILTPLVLVLIYIAPHLFTKTDVVWLPASGDGALWIDMGSRAVRIGLSIDNTQKVLLFMVTLVCTMIHLFASEYMKLRDGQPEPRYTRFFAFLSLFTFSMILLAMSDNLLTLFAGWELMGLCSYLLIGFYYEKKSAQDASLKAFMTTRVGDVLLFLALAILWTACGSLRFGDLHAGLAAGKLTGTLLTAAGVLALCGAIGKSAQFPLHTWLPDAMEGPTPVSALIHAATMVAAGVYLAARLLQIGILDADAQLVIAYIGGFTAIFAASIAFVQNDIKRVLAYSTISQLGYMMLAVGTGHYTAAIFHLLTHAFFKACMFLGSGSVIHSMHDALHHVHSHADAQDMRNMGGLRRKMPLTFLTFFISTLAISGVPLTAGFLSKDAVLAGSLAFAMENPGHIALPVMGFIAALMTAFYMFRLVFMTFFGKFGVRADDHDRDAVAQSESYVHESPFIMTAPLLVLAAGATFLLWSPTNPMAEGWIGEVAEEHAEWMDTGSHTLASPEGAMVFVADEAESHAATADAHAADPHAAATDAHGDDHGVAHTAHVITVALSLAVAGLGILFAFLFYGVRVLSARGLSESSFAKAIEKKYGFDEFYNWAFIQNTLRVCNVSGAFDVKVVDGIVNGAAKVFVNARYSFTWLNGAVDHYVVDGAVNGVGASLRWIGSAFRRGQTGMIQNYLLVIFTGLIVLIFIVTASMR